jgi:hypothetical protein
VEHHRRRYRMHGFIVWTVGLVVRDPPPQQAAGGE